MSGTPENPGIMPRAISLMYEIIRSQEPKCQSTVDVNMLEIYNDKLLDLLDENLLEDSAKLQIKKDTRVLRYQFDNDNDREVSMFKTQLVFEFQMLRKRFNVLIRESRIDTWQQQTSMSTHLDLILSSLSPFL